MTKPILFQAIKFDLEGHYDSYKVNNFSFLSHISVSKIFLNSKIYSLKSVCEEYIQLRNGNRKIYLRNKGANVAGTQTVMLSYQNLSFLGDIPRKGESNSNIVIRPSCYFVYKFKNQNSETRRSIIVTLISIMLLYIIYTFIN